MTQASDWPNWLAGWPLDQARLRFSPEHHGDFERWQAAVECMPPLALTDLNLSQGAVGGSITASPDEIDALEASLQKLHPWRKGPFQLGPIYIDTEWRSDWKWDRLAPAMGDLSGQRILDIGSGNGYFGWRLLGAGAAAVVGIDPTLLFCMQHRAIQRLFEHPSHWVLPLGIEEIPATTTFNWVLSMGVLYHRKDPMEHIRQMFALTEPAGQCVMETLIVNADQSLYPKGRYARMRNIGVIPNLDDLIRWMGMAGYRDIRVISVSATTLREQRATAWMRFESLDKALNPEDASLTVEGLPAPLRAILVGTR
ncbi:MAG: tRNA 5-methoxyuridine(34)/uridine 5-oxyacetic acid(34) synthase CmoB [Pseudomonadota bacterium]|jgi:tRNA (mo5U34)-methyltransferase|nr:tRNA 5-methoxyuridine(34)/uridine 5-oxyacetic acid(34) synthase CmoB [Pseudomonadota bacterium]